jgi:predicted acetyltransferase
VRTGAGSAARVGMMAGMTVRVPELVNPVPADEIGPWTRAMIATFLGDPDSAEARRWVDTLGRRWQPERAWGVRDRGRWVATLRTETRALAVPGYAGGGIDLRADALTNVTVSPTHRRRGLMSRMLEGSLSAARERGDAVSILIAAEWPIYGRFGYAPATVAADYELRRSRAGAWCAGDATQVRQVEREEFAGVAPAVFAAARRRRAGHVDRDPEWWNRTLGREGYAPSEDLPHNWLVHDGVTGPDGLLAWKATRDSRLVPPLGAAQVWTLTAATDAAYQDLWAYLTGLDGIDDITLPDRPVDERVRWLLADARTLVMTEWVDSLWLRILDVPAALTARRYGVAGELVLEVIDENVHRFASGRYRLSADGDEVACAATGDDPDVAITQQALASIYLGGFRPEELRLSGAVQERTPGALGRLGVMFSTPLAPWNATSF